MKLVCLAAAALAALGPGLGASETKLPSADEIVARYVEARGGAERLRSLRSVIYRGVYREGDYVSDHAAMALMRPFYKLVGDPDHPNPEFAEGYDGSAWEYYGDPGIVLRTVGAAAAAARHGNAIDGPLVDYRAKGSTVSVAGLETIGDRPAYRLRLRMPDGFEEDEFVDRETWLLVASRKVAPVHAFGAAVSSETRFDDYRPAQGVLFPFAAREVEIATGRVMNEMTWTSIVVNEKIDPSAFSPPRFGRTPLQRLLDQLFAERSDVEAVKWSYRDFRRFYPEVETDGGIQAIGFQILKMGDAPAAVWLLEANAAAHPRSPGAAFGLGRAYRTAGRMPEARAAFRRALDLDPGNTRARRALEEIGD
jgi:hypothetical protein